MTLSLDPFSQDAPEFASTLPLFALIFAAVMVGVVIGGAAAWLAQGKHRRERGASTGREVQHLRTETDRLRAAGRRPTCRRCRPRSSSSV